jgi:hypothetical protein
MGCGEDAAGTGWVDDVRGEEMGCGEDAAGTGECT